MSEDNEANFSSMAEDRVYLNEPEQPLADDPVPRLIKGSRRIKGVRYFPPFVPQDREIQVLLVGVAPTPEEASSVQTSRHGYEMVTKPALLKGPLGTIVRDAIGLHSSLKSESMAYTVLCPWLLPKNSRYKPAKALLPKLKANLEQTIREIQPKIIVAAGKLVFDVLCKHKISFGDARGCWFDHEGTPLYLIDSLVGLITKPWTIETLITDFREVNRMYECRKDIPRELAACNMRMQTIDTIEQLEAMVEVWRQGNFREFSVDCEWGGPGWLDGDLRSIQFAWTEKDACFLRFFDENKVRYLGAEQMPDDLGYEVPIHPNQAVTGGEFYTDYQRVGEILGSYLNQEHVTYMAHHAGADTPWMEKWLGLKVHGKVTFDSEFALQTADEYAPLGLDDLSLRFTSFGRYDQDLLAWKRVNKLYPGDGYGKVPDSILIPYGQLDVLTVFQAKPKIERMLERQELLTYYRTHLNPFVTDMFHDWTVQGLPIDMPTFVKLRSFMNWSYGKLYEDLIQALGTQADELLARYCPEGAVSLASELRDSNKLAEALLLLETSKSEEIPVAILTHWQTVRAFNIRSSPQMRIWLFDIMGFTPVKTTKGGDGGLPQMLWERVLELPEAMQKLAVPATDKETLEILSAGDHSGMLLRCLAVSNVGNQCKGFLKAGDIDADGEVVQEHGLAKFIGSDMCIHPNFSLTETTRPRTWQPNILNLSSSHNQGVATGLSRVVEHIGVPDEFAILFSPDGIMPDMPAKDLIKKRMPTVRSIVQAAPGHCFTESDWVTAEVRGLAFISGDTKLIQLITQKDPHFGFIYDANGEKLKVRIQWEDPTEIAPEHRDSKYLFSYWSEGKLLKAGTEADLVRDDNGNVLHPAFDLHWILAEIVNKKPREILRDKIERSAAKITRFCIAEDELVLTAECGWIPIQDVLDFDYVWDGEDWVEHAGVVESGEKEVIFYQGLWASKKHKVWTAEGWVALADAKARGLALDRSLPGSPHDYPWKLSHPSQNASDAEWLEWRREIYHEENYPHLEATPRRVRTYDILNAGPRNRFACSGVIVSNSAVYGAVSSTIERRIEALTGHKPEEGEGERLLEALAVSQPVAHQFLIDIADYPKRGLPLRAASGRLRRFPIHSGELQGMPWRVKKAYLRAMGNEARNFFMQESVAATLSRACGGIMRFVKQHGMQGRPLIGLYDAVLTHNPMEERFLMQEIHQLFMQDLNCWFYHNRWMDYPVETDLVMRWSFKPSDAEKKLLYDPEYMRMEKSKEERILGEINRIRDTFYAVQPTLKARLNCI